MFKSYKKLAILLLLAIISLSQLQAQDISKTGTSAPSVPKFMVGLKVGFGINEFITLGGVDFFLRGKGYAKVESMQIMAMGRYNFNNSSTLAFEVGYAQTGALSYPSYRYTLHNVQANLLLSVKIPVLSVYEPRFFIGPSFGYNIKAGELFEGTSSISGATNLRTFVDRTSYFKAMDWGIIVGGEVMFDLKWGYFFIDARYRHGLTNINSVHGTPSFISRGIFANQTLRNAGIALQVGVGFPL